MRYSAFLLAVLPLFAVSTSCQAARTPESGSITSGDVKLGYEHVAARYSTWAQRKKEQGSTANAIYGQLKLAVAEQEAAPPVVKKRGTNLPLHAVGGYPKMLGQTYNAVVGMGTPSQLFNLTADSGSMLTWAVQASCKEKDCPGVTTKKTYDVAKSKTSEPLRTDHEAYGDGEMDVELFEDIVSLAMMSIKATIGGANKTFEKDGKLEHDGLFGLGRKLGADPEPIMDSLAKQDKTFNQVIAFDLGEQAPNIEIGGYDFVKYSKMAHYKVMGDEGWLLTKSSITAEGAKKTDAVDLLLDTGSSVSMLPASRMDAIMNRPGIKVLKTDAEPIVYSMPCDTKLNVQMILPDGTKVPIKDQDILMKSNDVSMPGCLSLLVGTTNPFLPAVAGTPILKSIYTVLQKTEQGDWIGLAPLQGGTAKNGPQHPARRRRRRGGVDH